MSPKEVHYTIEGYYWRRDDQNIVLAHFTAALLSPHTRKRIKPRDLYQPVIIDRENKPSLEERKAKFREIKQLMESVK